MSFLEIIKVVLRLSISNDIAGIGTSNGKCNNL